MLNLSLADRTPDRADDRASFTATVRETGRRAAAIASALRRHSKAYLGGLVAGVRLVWPVAWLTLALAHPICTVHNPPDRPPAGRKTEVFGWLTEEGRFAPDIGRLLEVLCEKLTELGVPIARATAHVRTLHPEFRGATRIWRRGESIEIRTTRHGIESTSDYQNS